MQSRHFPMVILSFFLISAFVHTVAQQLPPNSPTPSSPATSESKLAPDAAVITIHGLCGTVSLPGASSDTTGTQTAKAASDAAAPLTTPNPSCETVVTRQQFEALIKEANPNADPQLARSFANEYVETLMFARRAVETGLDKDPAYQALLQFKYDQALYSIFKTSVKRKVNEMSDAEVEKFYNENRQRYEQFGLLRIHVPNVPEHHPAPGSSAPPKVDTVADEAAMKALAFKIRAEAVAGGNFERLQAKAYKVAHVTDDPPDTDLGNQWTSDTLPAEELPAVLGLQPGQVSEPIHNANGWHIVKMVSRKTIPLSEARNTTLQLVVGDLANGIRKAVKGDLNYDYFVTPASRQAAGEK
jgi:parvulin-like peptidyl-prolyl isomerase